jgi:fatty-acyl-CoA synthase
MLEGLMQNDYQLTLKHVLDRMRAQCASAEVATLRDGGVTRASYGEVAERVDRLCKALELLGVKQGDRVATFMWNSQEHLELYMTPCMGIVLHMLNIRLFPEQLTYIVNHAEDRVIFVDDTLVPLLEKVAPTFETVEHYVIVGDGDGGSLPNALRYEDLLAEQEPGYDYPELDERTAAGLCYTSGTTGNPKGVLYSHRSNVLHCLGSGLPDVTGVTASDRVLPVVPMFHVNAWGLPYLSVLVGADLVMPGRFLQGEPLAKLIEAEKVTLAGAVPTIWMDLLRYSDEHKPDLSSLRTVVCGGAAVPESLMRAFEERHRVKIIQGWGMTETSPLGAVARPPADAEGEEHWAYRRMTGRVIPFVDVRLMGDEGEVPWDGTSTGEVEIRGPWIASSYYEDPSGADKFHDGWLRTGDVASIDPRGFMQITDRAKDLIKSGGEWISSIELENALMSHPGVEEAAVIAMPHERWTERPLACVVCGGPATPSPEELRKHLEPLVAKWWLPDEFAYIEAVPKTSVGKFDKKVLRAQLADGALQTMRAEAPQPAK